MDIIIRNNFKKLIQIIKEVTPPSIKKPDYDCIVSGCETNSIVCVGRNGDFYGFSVKVMEHMD